MTEVVFGILDSIGFSHPLHPAVTHIPMGMAIGAFFFALVAVVLKKEVFFQSASHCATLGLIFVPPTMLAGYMDWQHSFDGEWEFLIVFKMTCALILASLFATAHFFSRKSDTTPRTLICLYSAVLLVAVLIGFAGGELLYG